MQRRPKTHGTAQGSCGICSAPAAVEHTAGISDRGALHRTSISIGKAAEVDPVALALRHNHVPGLEITVQAGGALGDGFHEVAYPLPLLPAYVSSYLTSLQSLLPAAWKERSVARS